MTEIFRVFATLTALALLSHPSLAVMVCRDHSCQPTSEALLSVYIEIYTEYLVGSPSTFFVNHVFLVCLFVFHPALCSSPSSEHWQHPALFIRWGHYQISLRLEKTLLSNNYGVYINVLPRRESLSLSLEVFKNYGDVALRVMGCGHGGLGLDRVI